jgi:hypothetical protein
VFCPTLNETAAYHSDLLVYFKVFLDGETRFYVSNKYILEYVANNTRLNLMVFIIELAVT